MSNSSIGNSVKVLKPGIKDLFFYGGNNEAFSSEEQDNMKGDNGGDKEKGNSVSNSDKERRVKAGTKPKYWFTKIEKETDLNRERSVQNQQLLKLLDYRTAWIMRSLMAILVSVIAGLLLNVYIL